MFLFSGKYLRRNPLARAGFIFYLILIHLWSFVILFFHAHSFEEHGGDFGAHGPSSLMKQQFVKPDQLMNADASAAIPKSVEAKKIAPKQADSVLINEGIDQEANNGADGVEHKAEKLDEAAGRGA